MKYFTQIIFVFIVILHFQGFSQEKEFNGDPDITFETARKLAFDGNRKQAQDSLIMLLKKYPNYLDIRDFLASTYSWDGNYEGARKEFKYVLQNDSDRQTTWVAAINNELWAEVPFSALKMSEEAITYFNSLEILTAAFSIDL